jgi:peptidoglycan hydrolase-like protein with peptidoglycan-binding domain
LEVNVRRLILTTASILALAIGGAGVSQAANTSDMTPNARANMPAMSGASASQTITNPSRDQVREAQQQLQSQGLYRGRIDGILGPETKQALDRFQKNNGLSQIATLDQPTMDKLLGNTGIGQGSSTPPTVYHRAGTTTNPQPSFPGASGLGDHNTLKQ